MSDRGQLFLFSLLMIVGGLAVAAWLVVSGQALTVDGLFLVLVAGLVALVFALYVMFMINRAREAQIAAAQPAKAPAAAKKAPAPAKVPTESQPTT